MEAVTAAMQQLVALYGEGPVYAAAGGAAVFCAMKVGLPGGGAGKPSSGLIADPTLGYKCKEVANPGTKGWGYSGVRFERCKDDDMVVQLVGDKHYPDLSVRFPAPAAAAFAASLAAFNRAAACRCRRASASRTSSRSPSRCARSPRPSSTPPSRPLRSRP